MSKKLAIKGHPTRGKEVADILEMMGAHNSKPCLLCHSTYLAYYINDNDNIQGISSHNGEYVVYTLEEFLEKYPFKVGDKVIDVADGCPGIINEMKWDESVCDMKYYVVFGNGIDFGWYTNDTIKFYQSENSKDIATTVEKYQSKRDMDETMFRITHILIPETDHNVNDKLEYKIIDGYEFDRVENDKIILKVVKHKYPKTYDDCCNILDADEFAEYELITNFPKLINARNAYWKIAGEELGLGKPWEPDWNSLDKKHNIYNYRGVITLNFTVIDRCILVFPTKEMRDAFYKNFKDLIEKCKELL